MGKVKVIYEERPTELFSTMGCRTANGLDVHAIDNFKANIQAVLNNRFEDIDDVFSGCTKDGRGNICPTTIIMPTLALKAKTETLASNPDASVDDIFDKFMNILSVKIEQAAQMLMERFNHICSQSPKAGKFMYTNHTMIGYHENEGIASALKHGTLAIGQLGLAETLMILMSKDHTDPAALEYAKKIEALFADKCNELKAKHKLNFGVYYTPAENLCYTAMTKFKALNPNFEQENVTYFIENGKKIDKTYFTNSIHVPVWSKVNAFEKIAIEAQLTGYSSAGCITYIELPSTAMNNVNAVEKCVDDMMDHDIPYAAINVPLRRCIKCGERIYDEASKQCPKCGGNEIENLGRITGYLSQTVERFNPGKHDEYFDRTKHMF